MNDPKRLLSGPDDDLGFQLLEASGREAPSAAALQATARALGVPVPATGPNSPATAPNPAPSGSAPSSMSATAGTLPLGKWLVASLVGAGLIGGAVAWRALESETVGPAPVHVSAEEAASAHATAPDPAPEELQEATTQSPPPPTFENPSAVAPPNATPPTIAARAPQPAPARNNRRRPAPPLAAATGTATETPRPTPTRQQQPEPRTASIADELRLLDKARAELARGASGAALATLKELKTISRGTFDEEAAVVRIDALFDGGQRAAAIREARRFVSAHPGSLHASRLATIAKLPTEREKVIRFRPAPH